MRNRISGTSIAVLALFFPMAALAQLSISPTSQSVANAGDAATYVVTVTNPTASTQTFVPASTGIPSSWGVQLPASVTVASGDSQSFNLVLTTPLGQASGSYPFTVIVSTASGLFFSTPGTLMVVGPVATLDVDASITSTNYDALTDGLLIMRYLPGLTGSSLTAGVLGDTATRTDPAEIKDYLDSIRTSLDIDGNGTADAQTDGLLIIRYLFGLRGSALISGAVDPLATRKTAPDIETYIQTLLP